jgi:hypothetical protein
MSFTVFDAKVSACCGLWRRTIRHKFYASTPRFSTTPRRTARPSPPSDGGPQSSHVGAAADPQCLISISINGNPAQPQPHLPLARPSKSQTSNSHRMPPSSLVISNIGWTSTTSSRFAVSGWGTGQDAHSPSDVLSSQPTPPAIPTTLATLSSLRLLQKPPSESPIWS